MLVKTCKDCGEEKPLSQFPVRGDRSGKPLARCLPCNRAWVNAKPHMTPDARRNTHLKNRYNITMADQTRMLEDQDGCAICHTWSYGKRAWAIDHDHSCCSGRSSCGACVRGVLCTQCNTMIAMAHDDTDTLLRAVDYLQANVKRTIPA
jgi:hypothetical protein